MSCGIAFISSIGYEYITGEVAICQSKSSHENSQVPPPISVGTRCYANGSVNVR